MPRPRATTTRKQTAIGSARKEARAVRRPPRTGAKLARGINERDRRPPLNPRVHPKKEPPARGGRPGPGQVAVGTPNVPGYSNFVDATKYGAMMAILMDVVPGKAPGMTQGEMFDVVRTRAKQSVFPGSTFRWWAKCVQLDLESKGVLVRVDGSPLRWHKT